MNNVRYRLSDKKTLNPLIGLKFGAGDRGRTGTVSLPLDFESSTSANSITPANLPTNSITDILYHKAIHLSRVFYNRLNCERIRRNITNKIE